VNTNWINVKEKLPENGEHVLIAHEEYSGGVVSGYFSHGNFYDSYGQKISGESFNNIDVTHWQPSPERPKK
jgi:hypothetical protein